MTPAQLAEDIERRNREAQAVFSVAAGDRTGLNPVVADALAGKGSPSAVTALSPDEETKFRSWYSATAKELGLDPNPDAPEHFYDYRGFWKENGDKTMANGDHFTDKYKLPGHPTFSNESIYYSLAPDKAGRWNGDTFVPPSSSNPFLEAAKSIATDSIAGGLPFVAGQPASVGTPAINPNAPDPRVPVQAPETENQPQSFADLIMQNDAVRLRNKEAFDRREKADKARLTIAAVTDALASLGNLVGTTQGAFSQPQTYQVPFVHEDAEKARAEARNTANMLLRNDQSLRVAHMREDSANSAAALRQALEEERTRRAQMNNDARVALAQENARLKGELYEKQHGYRTEEQDQKFADQKQIADDRNRTTLQAAGVRAGATKYAADKRAENSVGGYTKTETETVSRDEYGNVTGKSKTTTRSPNGGPSTTTTTGSSGKKPNPMGSAPKQEGKKKKKNPMA